MDEKYVVENNVVHRYLQGRLEPEELIDFEVHLLDNPEILESIELDAALREHLPTAFKYAERVRKKHEVKGWKAWLMRPVYSAAFSFCLGVGVTYWFINDPYVDGVIDLVEVSPLRSGSTDSQPDAVYSLANTADYVMFLVQVSASEADLLRVHFKPTNEEAREIVKHTRSNANGDVVVAIEKEKLVPGIYEISVLKSESSTRISSFKVAIDM